MYPFLLKHTYYYFFYEKKKQYRFFIWMDIVFFYIKKLMKFFLLKKKVRLYIALLRNFFRHIRYHSRDYYKNMKSKYRPLRTKWSINRQLWILHKKSKKRFSTMKLRNGTSHRDVNYGKFFKINYKNLMNVIKNEIDTNKKKIQKPLHRRRRRTFFFSKSKQNDFWKKKKRSFFFYNTVKKMNDLKTIVIYWKKRESISNLIANITRNKNNRKNFLSYMLERYRRFFIEIPDMLMFTRHKRMFYKLFFKKNYYNYILSEIKKKFNKKLFFNYIMIFTKKVNADFHKVFKFLSPIEKKLDIFRYFLNFFFNDNDTRIYFQECESILKKDCTKNKVNYFFNLLFHFFKRVNFVLHKIGIFFKAAQVDDSIMTGNILKNGLPLSSQQTSLSYYDLITYETKINNELKKTPIFFLKSYFDVLLDYPYKKGYMYRKIYYNILYNYLKNKNMSFFYMKRISPYKTLEPKKLFNISLIYFMKQQSNGFFDFGNMKYINYIFKRYDYKTSLDKFGIDIRTRDKFKKFSLFLPFGILCEEINNFFNKHEVFNWHFLDYNKLTDLYDMTTMFETEKIKIEVKGTYEYNKKREQLKRVSTGYKLYGYHSFLNNIVYFSFINQRRIENLIFFRNYMHIHHSFIKYKNTYMYSYKNIYMYSPVTLESAMKMYKNTFYYLSAIYHIPLYNL